MPDPICWICLSPMRYSAMCAWWQCDCGLTVVTDERLVNNP